MSDFVEDYSSGSNVLDTLTIFRDEFEISKLCEVLTNECCTELEQLQLSGIEEHDVDVLCE